jgi:hypothetical protein
LPSRLETLQKACTEAQFNSDPAGCPAASDIATALVHTPLLPNPLAGPVYFVSHGGAAFPDTEIVLQGENGIRIVLDGHTQIKNAITYSRFESVPDAPFSSFEFYAPQGRYSLFGANGNFCHLTKTTTRTRRVTVRSGGRRRTKTVKSKRTVPAPMLVGVSLTGQNGAQLKQNVTVKVTGCPAVRKAKTANAKTARTRENGGHR